MPTFERFNGEHLAARVRTHDKAEISAHRRLVEDGVAGWREVDDPDAKPKRQSTAKAKAEAEAEQAAGE